MSDGAGGFRGVARRSLLACGRGLVLAAVSLAGLLLLIVSLVSVLSVAVGIGVLLAPESLLAVRRRAGSSTGTSLRRRRWRRPRRPSATSPTGSPVAPSP